MVPKYDNELRDLILKQFHDQANHREYHKTYSANAEKHIGITQAEVKTNKEAATVAKQPDTTIHNDDNDVDNTLNRYRSKNLFVHSIICLINKLLIMCDPSIFK